MFIQMQRIMVNADICHRQRKNIFITSYFLLLSHMWIREPGPLFSCPTALSSEQSSLCGLFLETKVTSHEWGNVKRRGFFENLNHCSSQTQFNTVLRDTVDRDCVIFAGWTTPTIFTMAASSKCKVWFHSLYLFYILDTHALNQTAFLISELVLLQITALF